MPPCGHGRFSTWKTSATTSIGFSSAIAQLGCNARYSKNNGACLGAYAYLLGKSSGDCEWLTAANMSTGKSKSEAETALEMILGLRFRDHDGSDYNIAEMLDDDKGLETNLP